MALAADLDNADAHHTLGTILGDLREWEGATAAFHEALRRRPNWAAAHHNLGNVHARSGRMSDAKASYQRAIDSGTSPDQVAETLGAMIAACHVGNDVPGLLEAQTKLAALRPEDPTAFSALLYNVHYDASRSNTNIFAVHREWAERFAEPLKRTWRPHTNNRTKGRRLRVGYVSASLYDHPVVRFQRAEMEHRDRDGYELTCYSSTTKADTTTAALQALADRWRDVSSLDDAALAERIRRDEIDVLVDLDGHDVGNRLLAFAQRPAPVQVTCNGYVDTTGMSSMDWRLTDADLDPPGTNERFHPEKLYRIQGGAWCYRPDDTSPDIGELPMLRNGFVTFGSLNRGVKHTAQTLQLWSKVLATVPGSRLVTLTAGNATANAYLSDQLASHGIDPRRVDFACRMSRNDYLHRLTQIDIALDPTPFTGVTTTCDALHTGVAVISLAGNRYWSAAGAAILSAVGCPHLATKSAEAFTCMAAKLARSPEQLKLLRRDLRARLQASPLSSGRRHARALVDAFHVFWNQWCDRSRG
jgi:predicted O-linked N-acetylglucosamine transferase (SPINDLY family)